MIQFNLLPDVKLEYLKTTRIKRTVMVVAGIMGSVALAVFITLLISVRVLQKHHLDNLNSEVKKDITTLRAIPDIDKILTIQNQLNSLPGLQDQKPVASRLFGFLTQVTPNLATISKIETNFMDAKTMKIEGSADSLNTVNKFVDTLKFTQFSINYKPDKPDEPEKTKQACTIKEISFDTATHIQVCTAFSDVVLSSFSVDDKGVFKYEINLVYEPLIFDGKNNVTLNVPKLITTRSELEKPGNSASEQPSELFKEAPQTKDTKR